MTVDAPPRPPRSEAPPARPSPARRHPAVAAAAFVAVATVLVAATVFAFVAASTTDGAADPEAAVRDTLEAFSHRDLIGVLESLPPSEREAFGDDLPDLVTQLQRLGVLGPVSLSGLPGVKLELRDVRYHLVKVYGEVGRVQVTEGKLLITPEQDGFPLPDQARQLLDRNFGVSIDPASGTRTVDLGAWQPTLVAIKDSGGWHTSVFFTLAEAIRGDADGPMPAFNQGPTPTGSETPTEAVRDLFTAAANLDPTRVVTLMSPTEARALYDYASLFLPEARRRAKAIETDEPFSIAITRVDLAETTHDGGTREVRVTGFDGYVSDGDEQRHLVYADGCLTEERRDDPAAEPFETNRTCDGTLGAAPTVGPNGDASQLEKVTGWQALGRAFPTFVVQERTGRWYISPTRTVVTTMDEVLQKLQPSDVGAFTDRLGALGQLYGVSERR